MHIRLKSHVHFLLDRPETDFVLFICLTFRQLFNLNKPAKVTRPVG